MSFMANILFIVGAHLWTWGRCWEMSRGTELRCTSVLKYTWKLFSSGSILTRADRIRGTGLFLLLLYTPVHTPAPQFTSQEESPDCQVCICDQDRQKIRCGMDSIQMRHSSCHLWLLTTCCTLRSTRQQVLPTRTNLRALKVLKHEIFDYVFFASKESIWPLIHNLKQFRI